MNSIYQLKTGEVVDLNSIVKIENLIDDTEESNRFSFVIIFNHSGNTDKIIIPPSLCADIIKKEHDKFAEYLIQSNDGRYRVIDSRTIEPACAAGKNAYKTFCKEVRNDLINAWRKYKDSI